MNESRRIDLNILADEIKVPPDVFICCASFEGRCKSVPRALAPLRIRLPIMFSIEEFTEAVGANLECLNSLFGRSAKHVQLTIADPLKSADVLLKTVSQTTSPAGQKYLIDITTFTHELLLILMRVLQITLSERDSVELVYATAADYSVGDEDDVKWLTKGIGEIRSVLGYPGLMLPARKLHLIVLTGYEGERAERLIDQSEPNRISIGVGTKASSIAAAHYQVNQAFHSRLAAKYAGVETFTFSPNSALETKQSVLEQARKFPEHNVAVAPMNTKVSTVGCALAAFEDDAIQLCYATAHQYNVANYTSPGPDCLLFQLNLHSVLAKPA